MSNDATASNEPVVNVITPLLLNLKQLLLDEKEHLSVGRMDKLELFARKKMQALSQIDFHSRNKQTHDLAKANAQELKEINNLLGENMRKLNFRIDAIGEIAETIKGAVREAEDDGTYNAGIYQTRRRS